METDILPASATMFRQMILNNSLTLIEVDIGDLTLDFNEDTEILLPFDLSIFTECVHLQKLTLDRCDRNLCYKYIHNLTKLDYKMLQLIFIETL
jgi:hypothetical protein